MANLDLVRRFAGVSSDADAAILTMCANAAEAWYESAGVSCALSGQPLYDFWVANLAAWMFDNRGASGDQQNMPPYILGSLHQLRALKVGGKT